MKCDECGYPVVMTHIWNDNQYRASRVYRCIHGHTFKTLEVLASALNASEQLNTVERRAKRRSEDFEKRQQILNDVAALSVDELAAKYNLPPAQAERVRQDLFELKGNSHDNACVSANQVKPEDR